MKKALAVISLVFATASLSAHAVSLQSCDIKMKTESAALGLLGEYGSGVGVADCQDIYGNSYRTRFEVGLIGTGLKVGSCKAVTHFKAIGWGFSLDQLIANIGRYEQGSMLLFKSTVGSFYRLNPFGSSIDVGITYSKYSKGCAGIVSLSQMWLVSEDLLD